MARILQRANERFTEVTRAPSNKHFHSCSFRDVLHREERPVFDSMTSMLALRGAHTLLRHIPS